MFVLLKANHTPCFGWSIYRTVMLRAKVCQDTEPSQHLVIAYALPEMAPAFTKDVGLTHVYLYVFHMMHHVVQNHTVLCNNSYQLFVQNCLKCTYVITVNSINI